MKKKEGALIKRDINAEIIKAAKHLFSEVGFKKTTVADIAHELGMSQTNVYRFFKSKAEINAAVCGQLFSEIEAASEEIARDSGPASKTLRNLIASVERLNSLRFHRKLHELLQTAYDENWLIVREHCKKMDKILEGVICQGMAAGEFRAGDAELAAILVGSACMHSWLMVQRARDPEPTTDQMIDFCLTALA
ncbi:MAG: TetR/AcrR family transcriptional regulator [Methylocella sp.]